MEDDVGARRPLRAHGGRKSLAELVVGDRRESVHAFWHITRFFELAADTLSAFRASERVARRRAHERARARQHGRARGHRRRGRRTRTRVARECVKRNRRLDALSFRSPYAETLLARPQTNGRARDALGGLCQRQRRGSGSCASSSSPMALPPGSCTQCRTRGHRALRRALDHCADAASASPTPGATREPRPDLQRRPVLTSSANLRLLARRTRDRPQLFENASLLNLCPARLLGVLRGLATLWRQYGVLAGLRVQLPNGLERTIVSPTSVPTDRQSLPGAVRFHPTESAARG